MECIVLGYAQIGEEIFPRSAACVDLVIEVGGEVDVPVGEGASQRIKPLWQTSLAIVDLLTAADEADNDGPAGVAIRHRRRLFGEEPTRGCALCYTWGVERNLGKRIDHDD